MTPVQKIRLQGFTASLKQRGVSLVLDGTELSFNALVQRFDADNGEFSVSNETRSASKIHILRSDSVSEVSVGSVLIESVSGAAHRVTQIEDHPSNVAVVFYCETASA